MTYLVAWTGGYEQPSFKMTDDEALARETFEDWKSQLREEDGDRVDLVRYDGQTDATVTIEAA